ncbi:MAG: hypothetical protein V7L29_22690 [Nostoc sp.]
MNSAKLLQPCRFDSFKKQASKKNTLRVDQESALGNLTKAIDLVQLTRCTLLCTLQLTSPAVSLPAAKAPNS